MSKTLNSTLNRKKRVRAKISGTAQRPRLAVKVSNQHITAQIIDDQAGKTLAYVTTIKQTALKGTMTEKATWLGKEIASQAKKHKVTKVVFDRGSKLYHGRLHALAEAARTEGLEF